jgi:hypothetical protein
MSFYPLVIMTEPYASHDASVIELVHHVFFLMSLISARMSPELLPFPCVTYIADIDVHVSDIRHKQQVNNQLVHSFLSQQHIRLCLFLSELKNLFVAGWDHSAADQPNNLAEGHPPLKPL